MEEFITTYTGKRFEPLKPDPDLICIEDIAHALSLICRGNGHVRSFWSVGEHCILCAKEASARMLSDRIVLACLLHDAGECYMSDVPRPLKQLLPDYREQEERLLDLIYQKYLGSSLSEEEKRQIKKIDDDLLWYDLENLLDYAQSESAPQVHCRPDYTVRPFLEVEQEYLDLFSRFYDKEQQIGKD